MKTIKLHISEYGGEICGFTKYENVPLTELEVSDEAAATIAEMLEKDGYITSNDVCDAINDGHAELEPLLEAAEKEFIDQEVRYRLFENVDETPNDNLETYFWEDIKDGLFTPNESFEEFEPRHPMGARQVFYAENAEDYCAWIDSHNTDYPFVAARKGIDLEALYDVVSMVQFEIFANEQD